MPSPIIGKASPKMGSADRMTAAVPAEVPKKPGSRSTAGTQAIKNSAEKTSTVISPLFFSRLMAA